MAGALPAQQAIQSILLLHTATIICKGIHREERKPPQKHKAPKNKQHIYHKHKVHPLLSSSFDFLGMPLGPKLPLGGGAADPAAPYFDGAIAMVISCNADTGHTGRIVASGQSYHVQRNPQLSRMFSLTSLLPIRPRKSCQHSHATHHLLSLPEHLDFNDVLLCI